MCPISFKFKELIKWWPFIIHFLDRLYQEINVKSHSNIVILSKLGKILSEVTCPTWFYFICLCSTLQCNRKMPAIKVIEIF